MNNIEKNEKIKELCDDSRSLLLMDINKIDVLNYLLKFPDELVKNPDCEELLFGLRDILSSIKFDLNQSVNKLDIPLNLYIED